MLIQNLGQKFLLSLLLAAAVLAALMLYTDLQALRSALRHFRWEMVGLLLLLMGVNLGARFLKWEAYLRLLDIRGLARGDSLAIFMANYALILTPGKVGGLLKSYFLQQVTGVPVGRTLPIMVAERLTDGLGMVLLTTVALVAYPAAWPVVALVMGAMAALVVGVQARPLAGRLLAMGERLPLVNRYSATLHTLYESAFELLQPRPLFWATLLGTVARSTEGVMLFVVLVGLGIEPSPALFANALFISALSNIIGVMVMMPGGLGGTEGSMTGLLALFVGLGAGPATAATLLARFGALWAPAALGGAALAWKRERFFAPPPAAHPAEEERLAAHGA